MANFHLRNTEIFSIFPFKTLFATEPVYVGMTGLTPEERFANHKRGYQAAPIVREHGVKLRPDLYARLNPMSYEDARKMEQEILPKKLGAMGFTVYGAHCPGPPSPRIPFIH